MKNLMKSQVPDMKREPFGPVNDSSYRVENTAAQQKTQRTDRVPGKCPCSLSRYFGGEQRRPGRNEDCIEMCIRDRYQADGGGWTFPVPVPGKRTGLPIRQARLQAQDVYKRQAVIIVRK